MKQSFGARWVVTGCGAPVRDAQVEVVDGAIVAIHSGRRGVAEHDLGEVALLPKLVNAHTHLEFSDLARPIGCRGMSITDWIPAVVECRRQRESCPADNVEQGLRESRRCGVAAVGEIATYPWYASRAQDYESREPFFVRAFFESLGSNPDDVEAILQRVEDSLRPLDVARPNDGNRLVGMAAGISPHAPYSISDVLFERLVAWARRANYPVAMHLAESREELRWIRYGDGPFAEMLDRMGVVRRPTVFRSPRDYLMTLADLPHVLVVHGNYLDDFALDVMANHREHFHVVYCPRTHAWFDHERWPMTGMLSRRISVCLGTDSRASNPDLDMAEELRCVRRSFPEVDGQEILAMGTRNGARALGVERWLGTLEPGKLAAWNTVSLPPGEKDPVEYYLNNHANHTDV